MKAITLWQPHASLLMVAPPGEDAPRKRYETRFWRPPANLIGQRMAIHAAKTLEGIEGYFLYDQRRASLPTTDPAAEAVIEALRAIGVAKWSGLPRSVVLGTAVLAAVHRGADLRDHGYLGYFGENYYAWEYTDHVLFPEPVSARGRQGLWEWKGPISL